MKPRMAEPENEPTLFSVFAEEGKVDGRGDEAADRREEGRHRARIRMAIGDYFVTKRKRR